MWKKRQWIEIVDRYPFTDITVWSIDKENFFYTLSRFQGLLVCPHGPPISKAHSASSLWLVLSAAIPLPVSFISPSTCSPPHSYKFTLFTHLYFLHSGYPSFYLTRFTVDSPFESIFDRPSFSAVKSSLILFVKIARLTSSSLGGNVREILGPKAPLLSSFHANERQYWNIDALHHSSLLEKQILCQIYPFNFLAYMYWQIYYTKVPFFYIYIYIISQLTFSSLFYLKSEYILDSVTS